MPENPEEKEKCLRKLSQMEKFLPFLDFMIDKIKKKSSEISLECQLSKFQNLRSMIHNKNSKHNWDAILKVEEVIEKLIAKLDYKEEAREAKKSDNLTIPKDNLSLLKVPDSTENTNNTDSSVFAIPSSTMSSISLTNVSSLSPVTCVDERPQDSPMKDILIQTIKQNDDIHPNNHRDNGEEKETLASSVGPNQSRDNSLNPKLSGKLETDLDKDLDGFDLTDNSVLCEKNFGNNIKNSSAIEIPKLIFSDQNLVSNSREKLIMALGKVFTPSMRNRTSTCPAPENNFENTSDSQIISALNCSDKPVQPKDGAKNNAVNVDVVKNVKKGFDELISVNIKDDVELSTCEKKNVSSEKAKTNSNLSEKSVLLPLSSLKPLNIDHFSKLNKSRSEFLNTSQHDLHSKQTLKEKLTADIGEVYKMTGKSFGGSLRSLKDAKESKKVDFMNEDELFKPDKVTKPFFSNNTSLKQKETFDEKHLKSKTNEKSHKSLKNKEIDNSNFEKNKLRELEDSYSVKHLSLAAKENGLEDKQHSDNYYSNNCKNNKYENIQTGKEKNSAKKSFNDKESLEVVKENMLEHIKVSALKQSDMKDFKKALPSYLKSNACVLQSGTGNLNVEGTFQDTTSDTKHDKDLKNNKIVNSLSTKDIKRHIKHQNKERLSISKITNSSSILVNPVVESLGGNLAFRKNEGSTSVDERDDSANKLVRGMVSNITPIDSQSNFSVLQTDNKDSKSENPKSETHIERDPRKKKHFLSISSSKLNPSNKTEKRLNSSSSEFRNCSNDYSTGKFQISDTKARSKLIETGSKLEERIPQLNLKFSSTKINLNMPQNQRNINETRNDLFESEKSNSKPRMNQNFNSDSSASQYFQKSGHRSYSSEAKSYIEYKKLKKMEEEKKNSTELFNKREDKPLLPVSTHASNFFQSQSTEREKDSAVISNISLNAKESAIGGKKTIVDWKNSKKCVKNKSKLFTASGLSSHKNNEKIHGKNKNLNERVTKDQKNMFLDIKKNANESKKKALTEKAFSQNPEETISPLECLYKDEKSDTTKRGYCLLNFKIPKKVPKEQENISLKEELQKKIDNLNNKITSSNYIKIEENDETTKKKSFNPKTHKILVSDEITVNVTEDVMTQIQKESQVNNPKNNKTIEMNTSANATATNIEEILHRIPKEDEPEIEVIGEIKSEKLNGEGDRTKNEQDILSPMPVDISFTDSKCTSFIRDANSNVHFNSGQLQSNTEKTMVLKEEITQDLVESLIRKSFQSGEGKLLLAQAKLFEKLASKLNSKKLKTIQKIINSESDDSSSSSDIGSDSEKKKEGKKGDEKQAKCSKIKKKFKKIRVLDSASSENENDRSTELITKEEKNKEVLPKEKEKYESSKTIKTFDNEKEKSEDEIESKATGKKMKKTSFSDNTKEKCSEIDLKKCMSNKKNLRKEGQKELLEQFMNEKADSESRPEIRNSDIKELELKAKPRSKTKAKTELDRLHDDIRNMFICSGVVTATGLRMCRMLKEADGSMNDLDIVKESAKMVKEEKLKVLERKMKSRKRYVRDRVSRTDRTDENNSFTREGSKYNFLSSVEKLKPSISVGESWFPGPVVRAENFNKQPCVLLHRLDLNMWLHPKKDLEGFGFQEANNSIKEFCEERELNADKLNSNSNHLQAKTLKKNFRECEQISKLNKKKEKKCQNKFLGDTLKNSKTKFLSKNPKKKGIFAKISNLGTDGTESIESINGKNKINHEELLNDAFEKRNTHYSCQLDAFDLNNLEHHDKFKQKESEILISPRLNVEDARRAIADSVKYGYTLTSNQQDSFLRMLRRRANYKFRKPPPYVCRFCQWAGSNNFFLFFMHTMTHTGEYKYRCPVKKCKFTMTKKRAVKRHLQKSHKSKGSNLSLSIKSWCPIPDKFGTLFGFLCSKCHYVQISLVSMRAHVKDNHFSETDTKIFKINMSSKLSKVKFGSENSSDVATFENVSDIKRYQKLAIAESEGMMIPSEKLPTGKEVEKYSINVGIPITSDKEVNPHQVIEEKGIVETSSIIDCTSHVKLQNSKGLKAVDNLRRESQNLFLETPKVDDLQVIGKSELNEMPDSILLDTCFDIESATKGLEEVKAVEPKELPGSEAPKLETMLVTAQANGLKPKPIRKLKVGPLEAQILNNSVVLYECFVKGCLFSTKVFDLFEKHVKISHAKTKWNGICKVCYEKNGSQVHLTSYKLIYALNHLKHHEKDNEPVTIKSLTSLKKKSNLDVKLSSDILNEKTLDKSNEKSEVLINESSYPRVPLLRVRNLVGDRLSTPKETMRTTFLCGEIDRYSLDLDKNEPGNSIPSDRVNVNEEASAMFTIENVRSLKSSDATEKSDLEVDDLIETYVQESGLTQEPNKVIARPKSWNSCGIPIRPCPPRTIAIRPDCGTLRVDVGQLNVVQAASVVLNSLTNVTPIRKISTPTTSPTTSKFTVQPVMVSVTPPFLSTSKTVSVMVPVSSVTTTMATTPSVSALFTSSESASQQQKAINEQGNQRVTEDGSSNVANTVFSPSPEVSVSVSNSFRKSDKSFSKRLRTKVYRSNQDGVTSSSELEDTDEIKQKTSISLQKLCTSNFGNKSVKDSKIYQEMLTKKKLCHLFKCMAIECSFTCNKESVFTQHIGLHEAQRRMKNSKSWKNNGVDLKLRKTLNWYQCAYCCEVLTNTSFALSRHVIKEHGHCIYQCAYCFYRAVSQSYVEIHQNMAHADILKTNSRIIYKCQPLSSAPPATTALEKQGRRQSVRPYHCDQCGNKFFITQEFMSHLTSEHQSVTAYTCHICKNLCFKADRLINHYKLHSYCTYQCAYCLHGTETEKEMIFHLCNFHFSQPAYMYVRAFAENQSGVTPKKSMSKKKFYNNQLDSLKVIAYENDKLSSDCIVEADPDEESLEDIASNMESTDISAIAAELGISIEPLSSLDTCLLEDSSSTADSNTINSSTKSVMPENEVRKETAVLMPLGNRCNRESIEEKDLSSVPLGQLSLEVLTANNKDKSETSTESISASSNTSFPNKNLKLNEIIINLHNKEKQPSSTSASENIISCGSVAEKVVTTGFHKLPPVVLSRKSSLQHVYTPKSSTKVPLIKKLDESIDENFKSVVHFEKESKSDLKDERAAAIQNVTNKLYGTTESEKSESLSGQNSIKNKSQPLITSVVSLHSGLMKEIDLSKNQEPLNNLPKISEISSLSSTILPLQLNPKKAEMNIQNDKSGIGDSEAPSPSLVQVDFSIDVKNNITKLSGEKEANVKIQSNLQDSLEEAPLSPEVVILDEEKTDNKVLTVTIDSDDEKELNKDTTPFTEINDKKCLMAPADDHTIRQEMEKLRNQIANETDCLLFDDINTNSLGATNFPDISVAVSTHTEVLNKPEGLLSPIEEAISSLNKKLEEEGEKKKKEKLNEDCKKVEEIRTLPRTRSFMKEKARKNEEGTEKSDSDDSNAAIGNISFESNKKDPKIFKQGLTGKDLYICGNDKCLFAAEGDVQLKDHLYVCDLSRETISLMCPHCFKPIKQFNTYIEHLKHHGEKKYQCGLCSFTSAVETSVTRHVKQKHKCDQLKSLPADPPKEGFIVFYPKNHKFEKQDFESAGYSPGDEDKLPLQAVYQVNVKCAKCPYFTKVRSNMVRHLKIHVKSVETEGVVIVPSTAPTNPVPCLDTKERMFDKMTNLAASSQLAQAKEKTAIEVLAPEDEAKLPQFVTEQMRYKCCLSDCTYITVDEGMLKHHIKALHTDLSCYSCPHCPEEVHLEVRNVSLDKIGYHLKLHDAKLYKCPHCFYFHYQKAVVEKHTLERHPERRYYVHTVREPKIESSTTEDSPAPEVLSKVWKCGLCDDCQSFSKVTVSDHLARVHSTKSKYKCKLCDMKSNHYHAFFSHFASKHAGEKVGYLRTILQVCSNSSEFSPTRVSDSGEHFDTTPIWQRGAPRVRHIRGILIEEEEVKTKKSKKLVEGVGEEVAVSEVAAPENAFYCPLCSDKKVFCTRNAEFFRSHLYQELNYQQFACTLCGKMFVDKKDYEKHHAKVHSDKPQALKQTKEDGEIMFWVDKVIAKQKEEMESKKRQLSEDDIKDELGPVKKKKKVD